MLKPCLNPVAAAFLAGAALVATNISPALAANTATWNTPSKISQSYAKSRISGDGYTNATNLRETANGWTAKADESGKPVSLIVTNLGTVDKT